ncbi:MAG: hypothetical protein ABI140_08555 [Jatrophihabitantaceae bacterium]
MTSNLGELHSEAVYRREQLTEDFRRAGGRGRGRSTGRQPGGARRWHLRHDHPAGQ